MHMTAMGSGLRGNLLSNLHFQVSRRANENDGILLACINLHAIGPSEGSSSANSTQGACSGIYGVPGGCRARRQGTNRNIAESDAAEGFARLVSELNLRRLEKAAGRDRGCQDNSSSGKQDQPYYPCLSHGTTSRIVHAQVPIRVVSPPKTSLLATG